MKFGLYCVAGVSSLYIRVIDGKAEIVRPEDINDNNHPANTPSETWERLLQAPGRRCEGFSFDNPKYRLLYDSRLDAAFMYGVPDDVDLYLPCEAQS